MDHTPQLVEYRPSLLARLCAFAVIPLALLLLLPIFLLAVLVLYLVALFHGGKVIVFSITGTQDAHPETQKPHFLEGTSKPLPDETNATT
jgi:hypothetical protein